MTFASSVIRVPRCFYHTRGSYTPGLINPQLFLESTCRSRAVHSKAGILSHRNLALWSETKLSEWKMVIVFPSRRSDFPTSLAGCVVHLKAPSLQFVNRGLVNLEEFKVTVHVKVPQEVKRKIQNMVNLSPSPLRFNHFYWKDLS